MEEQHRFDPKNKDLLDSPERKKLFPTEKLLGLLPIQKNHTILDVGAGTGYFSLPAAGLTDGIVYALDLEPELLEVLKNRMEEQQVSNIQLVEASATNIPLEDNSVDIVIASLVLHAVKPLSTCLNEIKRVMKKGAYLLSFDWEPKESPMGPPMEIRIPSDLMEKAFREAGFSIEKMLSPTEFLYFFVIKK